MSQAMITDAESTLPQEMARAAVTAGMPDDSGLEHFTRILDCLLDDTIRRLQGEQAFHLVDDVRGRPGAAGKSVAGRCPRRSATGWCRSTCRHCAR